MSAFLLDYAHINALVTFCTTSRDWKFWAYKEYGGLPDWDFEQQMGQLLIRENVRSLQARYSDYMAVEEGQAYVCDYQFKPKQLSAVELLKACDCYDYQSCETDDYHSTTAAKLVDRIRKSAIGNLPGYEAAPWSIAA